MNAAVGLMDGLGLDGDRCIRVIPRQFMNLYSVAQLGYQCTKPCSPRACLVTQFLDAFGGIQSQDACPNDITGISPKEAPLGKGYQVSTGNM